MNGGDVLHYGHKREHAAQTAVYRDKLAEEANV